jgi:DNA-binding PadR family transcriptional regulator
VDDEVREAERFLPLSPAEFHILLALADEERHGYGIVKELVRRTGGTVRMGPGTLYGTIKRLLAKGLIAEAGERQDDSHERRRYYRLTALGQRVATAEAARFAQLLRIAEAKRLVPRAVENLSLGGTV